MVDRRPDSLVPSVVYKEVTDPAAPDVAAFGDLMRSTFADPNLTLSQAQVNRMLAAREEGDRRLHLLTAKQGESVLGGTLFSYVPRTQCGFSEYIVLSPAHRGKGLARGLYIARQRILEADAAAYGHDGVYGLFIEVANPSRVSPQFKDAERRHGVDTDARWRVMHHFGFRRLDFDYVVPPAAPGKETLTYLDLLFRPMHPRTEALDALPAWWIIETLRPIWRSWAPQTYAEYLERLALALAGQEVPLGSML